MLFIFKILIGCSLFLYTIVNQKAFNGCKSIEKGFYYDILLLSSLEF